VFVMHKEQCVEVPVNVSEKNELLVPFIEFYSTVAVSSIKRRNGRSNQSHSI
ncbi:hypothetical protein BDB00DRAFT_758327, partial [Zychaea mexicana]|uniref:uncharacterized protein n=1 Tax=Zychaea mexicana TaxID=64656 RepID=UPI0022FE208F